MRRLVVAGLVLATLASSCVSPTGESASTEPTGRAGISEELGAAREVADGSLPRDVALDLRAAMRIIRIGHRDQLGTFSIPSPTGRWAAGAADIG